MIYQQEAYIGMEDAEQGALLKNRAILRNFEDAATAISDRLGYGLPQIETTRCTWILLNWQLQVLRRPRITEKLTVRTWVRSIHRIYSCRDFELVSGEEVCAVGSSRWTYWNIDTARPERITDRIAEDYGIEEKAVFPEDFSRIPEPDRFEHICEIPVRRSHIDINGHTHNLFYMDFALDALPEEAFPSGSPGFVSIAYKKETRRGDRLLCGYHRDGDTHVVSVRSGDMLNALVLFR